MIEILFLSTVMVASGNVVFSRLGRAIIEETFRYPRRMVEIEEHKNGLVITVKEPTTGKES